MSEKKSYITIFQSAFLFGFVQVFGITIKVILNKSVALLIGPEGIGLIGLYNSTIGLIKTASAFGIAQSSVKEISSANEDTNIDKLSLVIYSINRLLILTAFIGLFFTTVLSSHLSQWLFANNDHLIDFILLGVAIAFTILWEGQMAILRGTRQRRMLAKANIYSGFTTLIFAVPLYIFFEMKAIIPVLIMTPGLALLFTFYYVRRINVRKIKIPFNAFVMEASPIVRMGVILSFATLLSQLATFTISVYLNNKAGLETLGLYNAGVLIMVGYFSVIINALTTDYYPRIAGVKNDNYKMKQELNQQAIVSLLLTFPLIILFLFVLEEITLLLYSSAFLGIVEFIQIGIFGTIITIFSNQLDLILVVKDNSKVYIIFSIVFRTLEVVINIYLFDQYGLLGLGYGFVILSSLHMVMMLIFVQVLHNISFDKQFIAMVFVILPIIILTNYLNIFDLGLAKFGIAVGLCFGSFAFSYFYAKRRLGLNLKNIISKK